MAIDETLLANARESMLRIYRWERPAVSFGCFGKLASIAPAWPGRELVRRMSGGGAVPHGADLTYSLIVPAAHVFADRSPRAIYLAVHEAIAGLLVSAGVAAVPARASAGPSTGVCFDRPVEFDLIAEGKKIAGAAMKRNRNGLLIQGSIQHPSALEHIRGGMAAAFAEVVIEGDLTPAIVAAAELLAISKYATPEWTARL
jgi:lipoate-protein ligase A